MRGSEQVPGKYLRVLFLTQGDLSQASSRFRVYQYLEAKEINNSKISSKVMPLPQSSVVRRSIYLLRVFFQARSSDVVFIQKILFPDLFLQVLRHIVRRLVYDWDDALYAPPPILEANNNKQQNRVKKLKHVLRLSDTVVCGNKVLEKYASKYCKDVRVIPTSVIYRSVIDSHVVDEHCFTIGWIGRSENLRYVKQLTNIFNKIYQKYGESVRLKVVCDQPLTLHSPISILNKEWSLRDELTDINSFDLGIMPLEDTEWARGKCAFKLLQYMAMGIPSIGSPVGANVEVIESGVNGFLADDDESWFACLSQLIDNAPLRVQFADAALCTVKRDYSLQNNQYAFLNAVIGK